MPFVVITFTIQFHVLVKYNLPNLRKRLGCDVSLICKIYINSTAKSARSTHWWRFIIPTTHCNLNCAYCEDFGARRNPQAEPVPALDDVRKILSVIRSGIPRLWLTGGEPLMAPHLLDLLRFARQDLKFQEITLISNGTLLEQHLDILPFLDRLVISLDSVDPDSLDQINLTSAPGEGCAYWH